MTVRRPNLMRALPLLLMLCLPLAAFADAGYVSVPDVAKANGLQYKEVNEGDAHLGILTSNGQRIMLYSGQPSIVVNGTPVRLPRPVQWNGTTLEVPEEAVGVLTGKVSVPAATAESPRPAPAPLKKVRTRPVGGKVVIDPGHGGHDIGAQARAGSLDEKDIALEVALAVGAHLRSQGVTVVYTRKSDVFIELADRAAIANRERPDLFLAIHVNADDRTELRGAMLFYPADNAIGRHLSLMDRAREAVDEHRIRPETFGAAGPVGRIALLAVAEAAFESYRLSSIAAAHCLQRELRPVTGLYERGDGVLEDFRSLHVLRETRCPALLVEMDFLSNRASERKLNTQGYRSEIAKAISEGVMDYLAQSSDEGAAR